MALIDPIQSNPAATTETNVYTVATGKQLVISSLTVCNRDNADHTFRLYLAPGGAVTSNEMYVYYDVQIPANDTFAATLGITLIEDSVIRVYADAQELSFQFFGDLSDI